MPRARFPIGFKISVLYSALFFVAIAAINYATYISQRNILEQRIVHDFSALANTKAFYIQMFIEEDFEDARMIALRTRLPEALESLSTCTTDLAACKHELDEILLNELTMMPSIKTVSIVDPHGIIVASTRHDDVGRDTSKNGSFIKGCAGPHVNDPYMIDGILRYSIDFPIFNRNTKSPKCLGVINVQIDASRLQSVLADKSGMGITGECVIGKRDKDTIAFLMTTYGRADQKVDIAPKHTKLAEPMQRAINKENGSMVGIDYHGTRVIATYRYLEISDWGFVVKIDEDEAFAPIHRLLTQSILISAGILLISIVITMLFSYSIVRPIKELEKGAKMIASGDHTYRVGVKSTDEIGRLASNFNHMAEHIQTTTVSIDRLKKEIEHRKKVEKDLQEALETKSKFTSMVSHELRTPLAAIKEGLSIVADGIVGPINKEQKDFLTRSKNNVDRLARLINDILDYQRITSGKMVFNMHPQDVTLLARDAYKTMEPLIRRKKIGFIIQTGPPPIPVVCDKDRIEEVFSNLLHNAYKFTESGRITISAHQENAFAHVTVQDTGCGIQEKYMNRLFESFAQLGSPNNKKDGTGLGLAISREIITAHNGKIWAESEYGKGTTIHFTLPLAL